MQPDKYETGSGGFVWQNMMPDELFSKTQFHVYAAFNMLIGEQWAGNEFINHYNRLYYIKSGEGVLQLKNRKMQLKAGHLYLIPPYQLKSHYCVGDLDFAWIHFQAKVDTGIDLFMLYGDTSEIDCANKPELVTNLAELVDISGQLGPMALFEKSRLLLSLLQPFMQLFEQTKQGVHSFRHQALLPALAMINNNVAEAPDVKDMAAAANVSPEHFSRKFKAAFNISPKRYILQKKIALAKQKLLLSNVSVELVAEQSGFCDIFYFSRVFKQEIGLTPSAFRKEYDLSGKQ